VAIVNVNYTTAWYVGQYFTGSDYVYYMNYSGGSGSQFVHGGTAVANTWQLLTAEYDANTGTALLQVNGTTVATASLSGPTSGATAPIYAFTNQQAVGSNGFQGGIGDFAAFTDAKVSGDRAQLNRYMGAKYGISVP
jgi:Concanavalin A-like lectin/glucanases superfamily